MLFFPIFIAIVVCFEARLPYRSASNCPLEVFSLVFMDLVVKF